MSVFDVPLYMVGAPGADPVLDEIRAAFANSVAWPARRSEPAAPHPLLRCDQARLRAKLAAHLLDVSGAPAADRCAAALWRLAEAAPAPGQIDTLRAEARALELRRRTLIRQTRARPADPT
ncbi:MAG: hypothetical protein AAFV19_21060 [Pseudomonadota bacterium]